MQVRLLKCPIRGDLLIPERAADGLTYSEEKRRIDCIRFLLDKGYPPSHMRAETTLLRFGHMGKNAFRTDLAVTEVPLPSGTHNLEPWLRHVKLIAEVKRDNSHAARAKQTQVLPALDFLQDLSALGVYWDDIEQRLFYRTLDGTRTTVHETALAVLPRWGDRLSSPYLRCRDLRPPANLRRLFERIEDILHTAVPDQSRRFEIMLQLLLTKLYDEHIHSAPADKMTFQDHENSPASDQEVSRIMNGELARAAFFYGRYLPKQVEQTFTVTTTVLRQVCSLLAPVRILDAKRDVVQDFYMYFAKGIYRWDLAQYFTPAEVVDFVVAMANPRPGDIVRDPACGSGDFLVSALRHARTAGHFMSDAVSGADNSENAVQVCVLNMVLNGDGKSNIRLEDSLGQGAAYDSSSSVMLCNPPFGIRILERRFEILRHFALGHEWAIHPHGPEQSDVVANGQETGLLFAELCVRQATPGGRIGIILPNGYLGNRSPRYLAFREWLLRHTRLVAVVAFPRFTFKKSGADVSASAVLLERRVRPLRRAVESEDYPFYAGIVESVGWSVSDKRAERIYRRDPATGVVLVDMNNDPIVDADFGRILHDMQNSDLPAVFPWLTEGLLKPSPSAQMARNTSIREVLARPDLGIDPKRWCERAAATRQQIRNVPHFRLGDIALLVSEVGRPKSRDRIYEYIELQDANDGVVNPSPMRGWQLPSRARHTAQVGDVFVGKVWGSVGKWFVAGGDCSNLYVSNGFYRLRMRPGLESRLVDVVAALNTEAYRIQMRSSATGSDGLAEVSEEDVLNLLIPEVTNSDARALIGERAEQMLQGRNTIASLIRGLANKGDVVDTSTPLRSTNWVQV